MTKPKNFFTNKYTKGGHNQTFYCGCDYKDKVVDLESCGYEVRKNTKRAKRTEAEHIVPAYWIANLTEQGRECWAMGTQLQGINGREYCKQNNPEFKQAHNDLMNLVPAIGEVNGDRSKYGFGMTDSEHRQYGACDFEVYQNNETGIKQVEPPQNVRGDIARIYLYMQDKYGLEFSNETFYLMKYWNEIDPISVWEQERIRRIEQIQGELLNN